MYTRHEYIVEHIHATIQQLDVLHFWLITSKTDNFIPVRRWIREHYTKLTNSYKAKCNYCNEEYSIRRYLANLHKHLVKKHSEKLNEEQKKEDKFHWTWDYFLPKSDTEAICKKCNRTFKYHKAISNLEQHFKRHK